MCTVGACFFLGFFLRIVDACKFDVFVRFASRHHRGVWLRRCRSTELVDTRGQALRQQRVMLHRGRLLAERGALPRLCYDFDIILNHPPRIPQLRPTPTRAV